MVKLHFLITLDIVLGRARVYPNRLATRFYDFSHNMGPPGKQYTRVS